MLNNYCIYRKWNFFFFYVYKENKQLNRLNQTNLILQSYNISLSFIIHYSFFHVYNRGASAESGHKGFYVV